MSFLLPLGLLGLLTLPLVVWLYWRAVWRGRSEAFVLMPGLESVSRLGIKLDWRQNLTAVLYLLATGLGMVALARPHATVLVPNERAGIVLALDVSGSMQDADIPPNRLEAAKKSAEDFVARLPDGVRVGVVSFAGTAQLEAPLTNKHLEVMEKLQFLDLRFQTAIGEGLVESLKAFPTKPDGTLEIPATVILLSDGQNRMGISPGEAAKLAAKLGVRVYTIGVGTEGSRDPNLPFTGFDEAELRGIADATNGRYYSVNSLRELEQVYRELGSEIGWVPQLTEISGLFALGAGLLLGLCLLLSALSRRVL
jgi:Ca-activated chloride channel homolog